MIRINLLPHREMRRERRKKDFVAWMGVTAVAGVALAVVVALGIGNVVLGLPLWVATLHTAGAVLLLLLLISLLARLRTPIVP